MTDTKKLKAILVENGVTQKEIAKKLGISSTSFNYKLSNKRPFNADEMFKLCDLLYIAEPRNIFFAQ